MISVLDLYLTEITVMLYRINMFSSAQYEKRNNNLQGNANQLGFGILLSILFKFK